MEAWIKDPGGGAAEALQIRKRVRFVFDHIEAAGPRAGTAYFAKINGVDDLWEAKVNVDNRAIRIFGAFAPGGRIALTCVLDGKKRQSLPTKKYKHYERMVKEHVALLTGGKGVARS